MPAPEAVAERPPPKPSAHGPAAGALPVAKPERLLQLDGFIQGQFQRNDISEDQLQQGGIPINQDQFLVRRARVHAHRAWDFAAASVEFEANTARGPRIGIRSAEASLFYRITDDQSRPPLVALNVGVMDIPFGFELAESADVRWFMERSLGTTALFPTEMDAGAKLSGSASFLRYAVAVMNGEPVDEHGFPRDPNKSKDVIGRFSAQGKLSSKLELRGGTSFAVGKGFHAGQDAGKSTVVWNDLNEDGTHQPSEFFGLPGSAATPSENFKRWAIGLDLGVTLETKLGRSHLYGEAFVASNYDRGFSPSDPVSTRLDARQAGGYVAFTQGVTPYGILGFRASVYDPNSDIVEVRGGSTLPKTQTVRTLSPLLGLVLPERARLLFQYDFVRDYLARDEVGVPTDAKNNQFTARLQVKL